MVIDFNEYMQKKENEKKLIKAQNNLHFAKENLANAYATKGLKAIYEDRGLTLTDEDAEMFRPLMLRAIEDGLSAADIERIINTLLDDFEEVEHD